MACKKLKNAIKICRKAIEISLDEGVIHLTARAESPQMKLFLLSKTSSKKAYNSYDYRLF